MARTTNEKLDRVSITIPERMSRLIEQRMVANNFASVSEWIRHAIREQLSRESMQSEVLLQDPEVVASVRQAKAGHGSKLDWEVLKKM